MYIPLPGTARAQIDTPALPIDLDLLDRNITALFDRARGSGVRVRPHLKTGKTPAIAYRLVQAEVMAAAGIEDILITTEIAGSAKIERLMGLLRLHPEVKVVVDSAKGIHDYYFALRDGQLEAVWSIEGRGKSQ